MSQPALAAAPTAVRSKRIESIDLLRGVVMIIMALDHVRDYFHHSAYVYDPTDLTQTSAPIFLTRWITHFCAPVFMLLAGVSASLYGGKKGTKALSFFLFTRGLWLVFAELFIVTFEWTFNPHYPNFILQVIWAFGIGMMALALLVQLPKNIVLLIGILFVAGHNALDSVHVPGDGVPTLIWSLLHQPHFNPFNFGHPNPIVGYPVIPWIGIISLGYCLGNLYAPDYDPARRKKQLLTLGFSAIVLFILLRWSNLYGDHSLWSTQKNTLFTLLSFVNTTKYPPSLLYTLMTLGPALLFLAWSEGPLNAFTRRVTVFGRVPMFYYLLHIPLIHLLAMIAAAATGHPASTMVDLTQWVTANPQLREYGFSLLTVYAVWLFVLLILYPLCYRYDQYKRSHSATQWWLSYL